MRKFLQANIISLFFWRSSFHVNKFTFLLFFSLGGSRSLNSSVPHAPFPPFILSYSLLEWNGKPNVQIFYFSVMVKKRKWCYIRKRLSGWDCSYFLFVSCLSNVSKHNLRPEKGYCFSWRFFLFSFSLKASF